MTTDASIGAHTTRTACSYCGVGCGISVETRTDAGSGLPVIARVSGDRLHPTNFGRLCTKGATHADLMGAGDGRLTTALLRRNGEMVSVTTDDATAEAGRRLRAIIDEHGPDAVALYVSGQMTIEAQYLANKLAKGASITAQYAVEYEPQEYRALEYRFEGLGEEFCRTLLTHFEAQGAVNYIALNGTVLKDLRKQVFLAGLKQFEVLEACSSSSPNTLAVRPY